MGNREEESHRTRTGLHDLIFESGRAMFWENEDLFVQYKWWFPSRLRMT